ncbi:hypothetical protein KR038_003810 [Drosophila bunnanda]|nr:hypothetical protein KR038_003810 [Drosophila bunnanda]
MRSLIIVALLAFLAVGFVAARPAEAEETAVEEVADGEDTAASSGDEATQDTDAEESQDNDAEETQDNEESTGEETEGDSANETEEDSAAEESSDADAEEDGDEATTTTTAKPRKHVRPFWPRFGGHGPVVVRRRGLTLRRA